MNEMKSVLEHLNSLHNIKSYNQQFDKLYNDYLNHLNEHEANELDKINKFNKTQNYKNNKYSSASYFFKIHAIYILIKKLVTSGSYNNVIIIDIANLSFGFSTTELIIIIK